MPTRTTLERNRAAETGADAAFTLAGRAGACGGKTLTQAVCIEAAQVPLHQPVQRSRCTGLGHRGEDGGTIETRVRPHQERQTRHRGGARQQSFEEIRGFAGRVLGARTQFKTQTVAFLRQVAGEQCVAVEVHVGAAHAFLGGAAIVVREDIEVRGQMARGQGREGGLSAAQQPFGGLVQCGERGIARTRQRIHALAQGRRRGHGHQAGRVPEESVPAQRFNAVEVGLAGTQQADIGLEQAASGNAALAGNGKARVDDLVVLGKAFEILPDQRQSCLRCQIVGRRLIWKSVMAAAGNSTPRSLRPPRRLHPLRAVNLSATRSGAGFA